jgi:dipeptidyl aminopeptidase/acylaminoacyl peptidase
MPSRVKSVKQFVGDAKLRAIQWGGNDHLLLGSSQTSMAMGVIGPRQEWSTTTNYTISDGSARTLMEGVENAMNVTQGVAVRQVDGKPVAYVTGLYNGDNNEELDNALFRIDLDTGHTTLVEHGSPLAQGWLVDAGGNVLVEADYNAQKNLWTLKRKTDDDWQAIATIAAPIDVPELSGMSEDGSAVLVRTFNNKGSALRAYSATTGAPVAVPSGTEFLGGFVEDPVTHRAIATLDDATRLDYAFFSPANKALWQRIRNVFSDSNQVELASWSDDKTKIVLHVFGPNEGDQYTLLDLTANTATPIGPVRADVGQYETAPIQAIAYSAADGLQIPAYLTLPRGVPAKALPLVVFPHGGPADRDEYGFDWWAQAMASRGYAVLQPEFRGSDGYGWDFLSAGFGEWGRKMQTDLSDGVRALAAQGTIDPKRVCIVGASYGGYAALAGATLDTGVYRCAASIAGISGLHDFLRWRESRDNSDDDTTTRYWLRFLGAASDDDPVLDQLSPTKHVDMVTIPILLIHGKDDTVVPIDQSEDMADALKDAKKDVTLVELEDEDHWLSRARTREQMLETLMDFLGKNNPP